MCGPKGAVRAAKRQKKDSEMSADISESFFARIPLAFEGRNAAFKASFFTR